MSEKIPNLDREKMMAPAETPGQLLERILWRMENNERPELKAEAI